MSDPMGDPIVALSTAPAVGAIAIVRCSAPRCRSLLEPLFSQVDSSPGLLKLNKLIIDSTIVDEPMTVFFDGPHSYTGQDMAEIHLHGSPWVIKKTLTAIVDQGFRMANPGEFTERAFLNGKMDLTQAEGIRQLIECSSEQEWLAARQMASGHFGQKIENLRSETVAAMAWLEARIDFPDEGETSQVQLNEVLSRVYRLRDSIQALLDTWKDGKVASAGLKVALYGPPNAGKSTLMNQLLQKDRAIVTDIPGTTRDYLEETCLIEGRLLRLIDTAGVRDSVDKVETLGIERSREMAEQADLVVALLPAASSPESVKAFNAELARFGQVVRVFSQVDRHSALPQQSGDWLRLSCVTGEGLDQLRSLLASCVSDHLEELVGQTFIAEERHANALKEAMLALETFLEAHHAGAYDEMLAFELRQCSQKLGSVIGGIDNEDVLGAVFGQFCVGK